MKTKIFTIIISIISFGGFSQSDEFQYPEFIGQNLKNVIGSKQWEVLTQTTGDLNNDGLKDKALILQTKDSIKEKRCESCYFLKSKPRIIIIALYQNDKYNIIIQNNKFIARGDEGGMLPHLEPELSIKDSQLKIYYQFTRSNQSYTFKYKKGDIIIVSAESNGVHSASGNFENDNFDFIENEITSTTGNISEEKDYTKIIKFNAKPKSLSEFKEMGSWEITENKFL
ncbi:hypothetical protein [uncultured Christiangramia sp.]|uniref:hypothetical protein n=1 Tax=uncultured Christiangramia sp. TaxID=503836 RepID=UPI00263A147C|nr:hypothetical protein [uncultured Christiangramia sp.]